MQKEKLVPDIRFKGFVEEWKESKIGNFLSVPIEEKANVNNASQLLTLGLNLSGLKIGATKNKLHFGATNYFLRKEGQFIYGKQNFFNGSMAIITPEFHNKASSKDVPSFDVKNIDNWFFYYYLARPSFYEKTEGLSLGTGSKRIHENILFNITIAHPESLKEQKKIRKLISNFNSVVSLTLKKLNKLRLIKESLLSKMLASKNQKFSEIRFKGFEEEWNINALNELINKFDNLRIPVSEKLRTKGEFPYYGANGIQDYVSGYTHDGEFVLVAEDGANDLNNYPSKYVNGKFWANNHVHVIQGKENVLDNKFLSFSLKNFDFKPILTGGERTKLNASALATIEINKPFINEQQKIGQFFSNLDSLIQSQELKLEKLNSIKQALLEKMFC
ncbi:restriction endonuclease subunit S [Mycoplasma sp. AA7A]|uniref:restriction endonuclease subunit S n=1 Tax=unclassified Mycoplasma TaxID=2683645 RepID=UPI003AAED013